MPFWLIHHTCTHNRVQAKSLEDHLRVSNKYVQAIRTLQHAFEATNTKKEATFENILNAKTEVMCLKNELRQAQM
jgi:hypothetical protein